ncbi:hypothetical protein [Pseudonocardia sp. N23]|uniref:hypothetical protein n=1 Tax=Pseudonocardia sp. N23 TaxID=1987376 RepID=UPI000BFB28DC|nr:hypothetical protein [Pseudonocardia sp. N23]GAY08190.1 hypothetical protein TOK_1117 [Pseudonocardia sp. N23]
MFNAMSPAQLTAVLSGVLREGADWARPLDGFQRGQLKSASSIGRHLASELAGGPAAAARFRADLRALLVATPGSAGSTRTPGAQPHGRSGADVRQGGDAKIPVARAGPVPGRVAGTAVTGTAVTGTAVTGTAVAEAARAVVAAIDADPAGDVAALGAPVGDLLAAARATGSDTLATAVRGLLRDLVDAEIDLLSRPVTATVPPTGGSR